MKAGLHFYSYHEKITPFLSHHMPTMFTLFKSFWHDNLLRKIVFSTNKTLEITPKKTGQGVLDIPSHKKQPTLTWQSHPNLPRHAYTHLLETGSPFLWVWFPNPSDSQDWNVCKSLRFWKCRRGFRLKLCRVAVLPLLCLYGLIHHPVTSVLSKAKKPTRAKVFLTILDIKRHSFRQNEKLWYTTTYVMSERYVSIKLSQAFYQKPRSQPEPKTLKWMVVCNVVKSVRTAGKYEQYIAYVRTTVYIQVKSVSAMVKKYNVSISSNDTLLKQRHVPLLIIWIRAFIKSQETDLDENVAMVVAYNVFF